MSASHELQKCGSCYQVPTRGSSPYDTLLYSANQDSRETGTVAVQSKATGGNGADVASK